MVGGGAVSSNCKHTLSTSLRDDSRSESGALSGFGNAGCASIIRWYRDAVVVAAISAAASAVTMVVVGVKSKVGSVSVINAS